MSDQYDAPDETTVDDVFDEHEEPKTIKVRGADGEVKEYLVCEFEPGGHARWISNVTRRFKDKDNPKLSGMFEELIEQCLRYGPNKSPVPREVIDGFGSKFKTKLYGLCQQVNGLDEGAADRQGK